MKLCCVRVTHALAMNREGSFESAPGVRVRCTVNQQRREVEPTRSDRGAEIQGCSQQLLHTGWISLFNNDATAPAVGILNPSYLGSRILPASMV